MLGAALGGFAVASLDRDDPGMRPPPRIVEVESPACLHAARAGRQVAKAAGTALYVAPDVGPLIRAALEARVEAEIANIRAHESALASALRSARASSERGDPPAWWRFERSSARCLGESAIRGRYQPGVGNEDGVTGMIRRFMRARVRGDGARRFVSADGEDDFGRAGILAGVYPKPGLEDFGIAFIDDLGDGSYEVGIDMIVGHRSYGETLFVSFDGYRYRINGGRSGLTGP